MFDIEDTVSKVASGMLKEAIRAAPVYQGEEFAGIVFAKDIVSRKIDSPGKTKIRQFVRKITPFPESSDASDLLNSMLINDYRAIPVIDRKGKISLLTKLDVLMMFRNDPSFRDKRASDIMNFPYPVSPDDSFLTSRSLIRDLNLSRLPVLGKGNRLEGFIDILDLLPTVSERKVSRRGELLSDDAKQDDVKITSFAGKLPPMVSPDSTVAEAMNLMIKRKTPTVIVVEGDEVRGIITPRDILKLVGNEISGVYVTMSGIQDESTFIRKVIDDEISAEIKKLSRFIKIDSVVLHIDRSHVQGKRIRYSARGRLITRLGVFSASYSAWDVTKSVRGILKKIEKETIKKKEMVKA